MPGYLAKLAEHLAGEQAAALKELAQLQKDIEHIKDIVTMQQSYAKVSGVMETVNMTDLVEDALRMNPSAFARHDIQVIRNSRKCRWSWSKSTRCCKSWSTSCATPNTPVTTRAVRKSG